MTPVITYNLSQWKAIKATTKEIFFVGGLGSGKSFVLGAWCKRRAQVKGTVGLLVAPTKDVLKNATLKQVTKAWNKMGLIKGVHYVVDVLPPKAWGVQPFSDRDQRGIITFNWGSYLVVGGLDNFDKWRGIEVDYIACDEFRDVKKEAYDVLIGRLRGETFIHHPDFTHQILCVTTPPEDYYYLQEQVKREAVTFIHTSSHENQKNLPAGYIKDMEESYDEITFQREVLGKMVNANNRLFMYSFSRAIHCFEATKLPVYRQAPLYLSWDFNLDPMTVVIGQRGQGWAHVIDEISLASGSPEEVSSIIKYRYPDFQYYVTGDREGWTGQKNTKGNAPMFRDICRYLEIPIERCIAPRSNMSLLDAHGKKGSRTLCNSVLSKHPFFAVSSDCKELIQDLERARVDRSGQLVKSRGKDAEFLDLFDGFRYLIHTWFPDWFTQRERYLL